MALKAKEAIDLCTKIGENLSQLYKSKLRSIREGDYQAAQNAEQYYYSVKKVLDKYTFEFDPQEAAKKRQIIKAQEIEMKMQQRLQILAEENPNGFRGEKKPEDILLDEAEFLDFDEGLILKDKVEYINPDRDEDNMVFGVVRDKFGQKLNPNSSDIDIRQANIPDDRVYSSQDVLQ